MRSIRMAASISEFGFKAPILARSSDDVIDGHLRLKAAQKFGNHGSRGDLLRRLDRRPGQSFSVTGELIRHLGRLGSRTPVLGNAGPQDLRNLDHNIDLTGFDAHEISRETLVAEVL